MSIIFPEIDPVIFSVGPIAIRWYALSYVAGILLGWRYIGKIDSSENPALSPKAYEDFIIWAIFGIILGGRLGYILFYNAEYYLSHPVDILRVWEGGMSFHGGLIGAIIAMYLMCKHHNLQFWRVVDIVACAAPIGLFFGRIANFINAELWGRFAPSDLPWGVIFPGHSYPRHPSQLYEAALEGLVLFCILYYTATRTKAREKPGMLAGIFLCGYGIFRGFVELYREPDIQIGYIFNLITMGQILCIPMILGGGYLIMRRSKFSKN